MKKIKLIPLLLAFPLITGCANVSSPHFKKAGDKLEHDAFSEAIGKKFEENIFTKSYEKGQYRPSFSAKLEVKESTVKTVKRNKKKIEEKKERTDSTLKYSHDAKNKASKAKQKSVATTKGKEKSGSYNRKETESFVSFIQKVSVEGTEYLSSVNKTAKTFDIYSDDKVTETVPYENLLEAKDTEMVLSYALVTFASLEAVYTYGSDEVKAKFSYYSKKDVYTVEYNSTDEDEENKSSAVYKVKMQADFSNNDKILFTYFAETESNKEEIKDSSERAKGDKTKTVKKTSIVVKAQKKNVTVKPVKVDKYAKYDHTGK